MTTGQLPIIQRLHFFITNETSQGNGNTANLLITGAFGDKPNDPSPTSFNVNPVNLSSLPAGQSSTVTKDLTNLGKNAYYIDRLSIEITGHQSTWHPSTLIVMAEGADFSFPIAFFLNWPNTKNHTWSTDPTKGVEEIKIYPLEVPRAF